MTQLDQDFTAHQGETVVLEYTITEDAAAKDLTGATIVWRAAESYESLPASVLEKTTSDGITITNAVGGIFQVALDPADLAALDARNYVHQAIVTFSNSSVALVSQGDLAVSAVIPAFA